uniref:Pre-rRNA-processing protein RIX1 N-terminal domain-containing protein n=1 Tax=Kalanchoe fedtschenkoi TaxID=63787 RepID=A0A7N0RHJ0_KALFE
MAAAFQHFAGLYDVAYKARRLDTLIKECVPDEERPFRNYSNIDRLLTEIRTHRLLSEPELDEADKVDPKTRERWRRAVDLWIERLLALTLSSEPDKCWFGISFLGLTCEACSSKRFEASYALWFQNLLLHVQVPAASDIVKAALCSSLSDLFTRLALGDFPDGKKEGVSFAGKLVQPLLKLLSESNSEDVLEGAVRLICTLLAFLPTSIHRHNEAFEASIVSNLVSEKNSDKSRTLAHCLAELPKCKGDETTWCFMMQKLLISVNLHLKYVFQGLEEDSICDEAIRRLVPGMDHPPLLGGQKVSKEAAESASKNLLLCCKEMITSSYPVQVTVPVHSILALIERVLMVDGSLAKSSFPFITVMQQESICSQLPVLHEHCLDLLTALMKLISSQLLPHSSIIVRLLLEYFNRCALPALRTKIYCNLQTMLTSMGAGLAVYISKNVIKNASADLDSLLSSVDGRLSNASNLISKESLLVPCNRKRKHSAAAESRDQQHSRVGFEVKAPSAASLSVMIAALEALQALLSAGGVSKDDNLQSQVDNLLMAVANAACKGGWAKEVVDTDSPNMHASTWADFQLASLKALKTSFLSSTRVRPPHLAQGLELFRRGELEVGTKIAKVCADALPSLEVLIHPRARAVADFEPVDNNYVADTNYKLLENVNSAYQKVNTARTGLDEPDPADDDYLYRSWLENHEEEADILLADFTKNEDNIKQPLHMLECPQAETSTGQTNDDMASADRAQTEMAVSVGTKKATENTDEVMLEQEQDQGAVLHEGPSSYSILTVERLGSTGQLPNNNSSLSSQTSNQTSSALHADDGFHAAAATATTQTFQLFKLDNSDDMDSFPDIVDAEPDSDSD